jgi:uncharacterized membrane protein
MIEILPNWHPILVHFTVALLLTATLLFLMSAAGGGRAWAQACRTAAYWNLWIGAALTVATVAAGVYAFNTVRHIESAHAPMTDHRNWALATATLWWAIALWSALRYRTMPRPAPLFLAALAAGTLLISVTAWKGGELVYRHGVGVLPMPQAEGESNHAHGGMTESGPAASGGASGPAEQGR